MPRLIGTLISAGTATLTELQTVYGVKDGYDLLEVLAVDTENKRRVMNVNRH